MKYAALKFNHLNIGCEIQSIASQRFLPSIDYYIFREQLNGFQSEEKVKLIMSNWFLWKPENFPPSECIDPLLISMHFNPYCRDAVLTTAGIEFFKKYGPVGCRDMSTKKWLDENHIPAYYSSCITSTLIANEQLRAKFPHHYILCVDLPQPTIDYIKQHTDRPVYSFSKNFSPWIESMDRYDVARAVLFMYQNAYCVITTNLHTGIPCLAFGTKVCMIKNIKELEWAGGRFDGMSDFFAWETVGTFQEGAYDFNNPPDNRDAYLRYRDLLVEKCKSFTSFDSNKPTLDDDFDPLHAVLRVISASEQNGANYNNVRRTLYYAGKKDMLKMLLLKTIRQTDMDDITSENYLDMSELFKPRKKIKSYSKRYKIM